MSQTKQSLLKFLSRMITERLINFSHVCVIKMICQSVEKFFFDDSSCCSNTSEAGSLTAGFFSAWCNGNLYQRTPLPVTPKHSHIFQHLQASSTHSLILTHGFMLKCFIKYGTRGVKRVFLFLIVRGSCGQPFQDL